MLKKRSVPVLGPGGLLGGLPATRYLHTNTRDSCRGTLITSDGVWVLPCRMIVIFFSLPAVPGNFICVPMTLVEIFVCYRFSSLAEQDEDAKSVQFVTAGHFDGS